MVTFPTLQVVDYKRLYKLGSRHTQKALVLAIGTQTRTWKMDTISNHRFSQARACGGALWLGRMDPARRIPESRSLRASEPCSW